MNPTYLKQTIKSTYVNRSLDKKRLKLLIQWSFSQFGPKKTVDLIEHLKKTGYTHATKAGISLGIDDLTIPRNKAGMAKATQSHLQRTADEIEKSFVNHFEYTTQALDDWNETSEFIKGRVVETFSTEDILNPVYMMAFSGARGNISQVRQLSGMRGLMLDPMGQVINYAIRSNFREGMTLTEYLISCYGARKGVVDTALRTATSGYLTRRLVDVAHHVCIRRYDCETPTGFFLSTLTSEDKILLPLEDRLVGRVAACAVSRKDPDDSTKKETLVRRNQDISHALAKTLSQNAKSILVRSPMTCQDDAFVCQLCYGWNFAANKIVSVGETVGIIAAQSIGEPGTQLTMRTFHTGGVFSGEVVTDLSAPCDGIVDFPQPIPGKCVRTTHGKVAFLIKQKGVFVVKTEGQQPDFIFTFDPFSLIYVKQGQTIFQNQSIGQTPENLFKQSQKVASLRTIYSPLSGQVRFYKTNFVQNFVIHPSYHEAAIKKSLRKHTQLRKKPIDTSFFVASETGTYFIFSSQRHLLAQTDTNFPIQFGDLIYPNAPIYFYKKPLATRREEKNLQLEKQILFPSQKKVKNHSQNSIKTIVFGFQASTTTNLLSFKKLTKFHSQTGGEVIQQHCFFNWSAYNKRTIYQTSKNKELKGGLQEQFKKNSKRKSKLKKKVKVKSKAKLKPKSRLKRKLPTNLTPKPTLNETLQRNLWQSPLQIHQAELKSKLKRLHKKIFKLNDRLLLKTRGLFKLWRRNDVDFGKTNTIIKVKKDFLNNGLQFAVIGDYLGKQRLTLQKKHPKLLVQKKPYFSKKNQKNKSSLLAETFKFKKISLWAAFKKAGFSALLYRFNWVLCLKPYQFNKFKRFVGVQSFLVWNKQTLSTVPSFSPCIQMDPFNSKELASTFDAQIRFLDQQQQRMLYTFYNQATLFYRTTQLKEKRKHLPFLPGEYWVYLPNFILLLLDKVRPFSKQQMQTYRRKIRHDHLTRVCHFQTNTQFLQQTSKEPLVNSFNFSKCNKEGQKTLFNLKTGLQLKAKLNWTFKRSLVNTHLNSKLAFNYQWEDASMRETNLLTRPTILAPLKAGSTPTLSQTLLLRQLVETLVKKRKRKSKKRKRKKLLIPQSWLWAHLAKWFLHSELKKRTEYSAYLLVCLGLVFEYLMIDFNHWISCVKTYKKIKRKMGANFLDVYPAPVILGEQKQELFHFLHRKKVGQVQKQDKTTVFNVRFAELPFSKSRVQGQQIKAQNKEKKHIFYTKQTQNFFTKQKKRYFEKGESLGAQLKNESSQATTLHSTCQDYGWFTPTALPIDFQNVWHTEELMMIPVKKEHTLRSKQKKFFRMLGLKSIFCLRQKAPFKNSFLKTFAQPNYSLPNQIDETFSFQPQWFEETAFQLNQTRNYKEWQWKVFPLDKNRFFLTAHSISLLKNWVPPKNSLTVAWMRFQFQDLKPMKQKQTKKTFTSVFWPDRAQMLQTYTFYGWVCFMNRPPLQKHSRLFLEGTGDFDSHRTVSRYFSHQKTSVSYKASYVDVWLLLFQTPVLANLLDLTFLNKTSFNKARLPIFIPLVLETLLHFEDIELKTLYHSFLTFYAEKVSLKRKTKENTARKTSFFDLFDIMNVFYRLSFLKQAQLPILSSNRYLLFETAQIYYNSTTRYKPKLQLNGLVTDKTKGLKNRKKKKKQLDESFNRLVGFSQKNIVWVVQKAKQMFMKDLSLAHRLAFQTSTTKADATLSRSNVAMWQLRETKTSAHTRKGSQKDGFKRKKLLKINYTFYKTVWKSKRLIASKPVIRNVKALKNRRSPYRWFTKIERPLKHYFQASFWNRFRYNQLCLVLYKKRRQWLTMNHKQRQRIVSFVPPISRVSSIQQTQVLPLFKLPTLWKHWFILKAQSSDSLVFRLNLLKQMAKFSVVLRGTVRSPKPTLLFVTLKTPFLGSFPAKNKKRTKKIKGKKIMLLKKKKIVPRKKKKMTKKELQEAQQLKQRQKRFFPVSSHIADHAISNQSWRLSDQHFLNRPNYLVIVEPATSFKLQGNHEKTSIKIKCSSLFKPTKKSSFPDKDYDFKTIRSQNYGECLGIRFSQESNAKGLNARWADMGSMFFHPFNIDGFTYGQSYMEYGVKPITEVFFLTQNDLRTFDLSMVEIKKMDWTETDVHFFTAIGSMINIGMKILPKLTVREPCQIIDITENRMTVRRVKQIKHKAGHQFLFSVDSFIDTNTPLETVQVQETVADDIIQGIPKIDKLFEARSIHPGVTLTSLLQSKFRDLCSVYMGDKEHYFNRAAESARDFIQYYTLNAIQTVYQSQNVTIADKHIEVIIKQMTAKVIISDPRKSGFLIGDIVPLQHVKLLNQGTLDKDQVQYEPCVLGITKSSLQTFGFISAAGFQETVNVLTQAAFFRKTDFLFGLKENVMLGHLIPAGTSLTFSEP